VNGRQTPRFGPPGHNMFSAPPSPEEQLAPLAETYEFETETAIMDSLAAPPDDGYSPPGEVVKQASARRVLKIFSGADFARSTPPERRWLVRDMIPQGKVTLLYGNGGDGKSLLDLQLAPAVATGSDWIGKMPERGRALILSAEDDHEEVHRRQADIIAGRGNDLDLDDLSNLIVVDLAGEDALLAAPDGRSGLLKTSPLFQDIERLVEKHRPIMLGIDTLADVYGADENVRPQVRQFIGFLGGLALRYDMAVVVLAHPSLSGIVSGAGTGGSTGWSNSVRSRLYLAPVKVPEGDRPDPALKQLTVMKANYGPTGETIALRWDHGRFVLAGPSGKTTSNSAEIDRPSSTF
jgi:RecA-family ATPase